MIHNLMQGDPQQELMKSPPRFENHKGYNDHWLIYFKQILRLYTHSIYNLGQNLLRHITRKPIFCTHPEKNAYCRKLKDCFPPSLLQCCLR